ncbi:MAG: carbon-nitrogen hydrolase [Terriglobales bacterium]
MARVLRIALAQLQVAADPAANLSKMLAAIGQAAAAGARVVCTPELFRSRYFCQEEDHAHFALAEPIPGPTSEALAQAARQHGVAVIASLFERRAAGLFHNTAVALDTDGSLLGLYRKMHIPDDPRYYEKFYFTPGDLGFRSFALQPVRAGVLVCWDQWFPEAARLTALTGAEILFYPTAIGWHPAEKAEWGETQRQSWRLIQRSHAIANGIFVAVPNRVGFEPAPAGTAERQLGNGIEFWGGSFVCGPDGEIIAEAGSDEMILYADCDLDRVERQRTHWPFLRDRRVDAYAGLNERWLG